MIEINDFAGTLTNAATVAAVGCGIVLLGSVLFFSLKKWVKGQSDRHSTSDNRTHVLTFGSISERNFRD
jgi:hypothetical protein